MAGCIPNSLFLSEVLVILSSCVFVVMALLTAVVSVTSITFIDKNEDSIEHHANLPNRYSVRSSFDLPSYSSLFPHFLTSMIEKPSSDISSFRFLILSSLRDSLIEKEIIQSNRFFTVFSDNLIQIIEKLMKTYEVDYNISTLSSNIMYSLFSRSKNIEYYPVLSNSQSSRIKLSFLLNSPNFLYDIEAIKSTLVNKSKPIAISIPFDLISFLQSKSDDFQYSKRFYSSFLQKSTYIYLIYGWNDDFLFKIPFSSNKDFLLGGFIVRQFIQETDGHSISYYYGNLSSYEETLFCPEMNENLKNSNIKVKLQLTCTNQEKCNTSSSYYLLQSTNYSNFIEFKKLKNSSINISFLEIPNKGTPNKVYINFEKIENFYSSFKIKKDQMSDQCNYLFIPYEILKKVFSQAKTSEQIAYGISSTINWSYSENLDLSKYLLRISDRPAPLFDI